MTLKIKHVSCGKYKMIQNITFRMFSLFNTVQGFFELLHAVLPVIASFTCHTV